MDKADWHVVGCDCAGCKFFGEARRVQVLERLAEEFERCHHDERCSAFARRLREVLKG